MFEKALEIWGTTIINGRKVCSSNAAGIIRKRKNVAQVVARQESGTSNHDARFAETAIRLSNARLPRYPRFG